MCFYGQQPWLDVVRVLCSPFHGNWLQRPWIAWSSVSAVLRHHLAHFRTIPQHTGLPSFLPRSVGMSWCFMFGLPSIVSFCPCLTKLCLHLYTNSQVWQVCLHLYTSWTQMQGTEIVCVCVSTKYRRSSLLSWQHHHFNFATKKENSRLLPRIWEPGTNIQTGSNRSKQDRHGMTWIWINTNKQIFPTLVCARVTLQCDRHCCCVSSIVGNLLGTIDLLGKPLRWIKISWLQWMNKHQCLRSPVLSILFCVCFFACLWFASFGATLLLVCFWVFDE